MIDGTSRSELEHTKYVSLTTFRKDGSPVPTPVWCVSDGGGLSVITQAESGKVKRLRNDSRVLVAPCDMRGNLKGQQIAAKATLQDSAQTLATASMIARRYGLLGRFMMWRAQRAATKAGGRSNQVGIWIELPDPLEG